MGMWLCSTCRRHVKHADSACPFCGTVAAKSYKWPAVAAAIGLGAVLVGCSSSDSNTQPVAAYGPPPDSGADTSDAATDADLDTGATMADAAYGPPPDTGVTDTGDEGAMGAYGPPPDAMMDAAYGPPPDTGADTGDAGMSTAYGPPADASNP